MTVVDPAASPKHPSARPPRELRSTTSHLLKRLTWLLKERAFDAFESSGLNPAHYGVLLLLEEEPRDAQATIADALGYDRSHLVGLLDELEERHLVERRRDPGDRRRHIVSLTPAGRKALGRLRTIAKRVEDDFFAPLDAPERAELHALLAKLASHHDPRYAADA